MDERLKKRLIGAVVLVALLVIFVPMMVEDDEGERIDISETNIPPRPDFDAEFESEVLPDPAQPLISPLSKPAHPLRDAETAEEFTLEPAPAPMPPPPALKSTPEPAPLAKQPQAPPRREPQQARTPTQAAPKPKPAKATPEPKPATQDRPAPSPPPKPSSKPAQDPKPVQQAKAPVSASPAGAGTGLYSWVVQVASFASRERADGLVQRLRKEGFPAFQEQAYVSKRIMYRVRVGPGSDRKRTEQLAKRLADRLDIQGSVVRYP